MATHSSILAWRIPWAEEPGMLVYSVTESDTTEANEYIHAHCVFKSTDNAPAITWGRAHTPPPQPLVCHCLAVIHIFSKNYLRTSLLVQWLGICLPMQEHEFDPRSRKIPRHGTTKSTHQNYGAHASQPESCNHGSLGCSGSHALPQEQSLQCEGHSPRE